MVSAHLLNSPHEHRLHSLKSFYGESWNILHELRRQLIHYSDSILTTGRQSRHMNNHSSLCILHQYLVLCETFLDEKKRVLVCFKLEFQFSLGILRLVVVYLDASSTSLSSIVISWILFLTLSLDCDKTKVVVFSLVTLGCFWL